MFLCYKLHFAGLQELQQLGLLRASVPTDYDLQQVYIQNGAQPQCQVPVWLYLCDPMPQ